MKTKWTIRFGICSTVMLALCIAYSNLTIQTKSIDFNYLSQKYPLSSKVTLSSYEELIQEIIRFQNCQNQNKEMLDNH